VVARWLRRRTARCLRRQGVGAVVADFGTLKNFFPDADVFPSVLVVRKPLPGTAPTETQVCVIPRDDVPRRGSMKLSRTLHLSGRAPR